MEITPLDGDTFTAILTYVAGASGLATAVILGFHAALMAPSLLGRFVRSLKSAAGIR